MSELKRHYINEVMDMHNLTKGKMGYSIVYYADDADKVIAEKDEEIVELKKQVHDYAQGLYVIQARADKDARHHKYKRCLAMAYVEWLKQVIICFHPESILYRKAFKRGRKWKELAEKFKEAK